MDICRVAIQADTTTVDVALPAGMPVGVLLPSILEIVGADPASHLDIPADWRLSRVGDAALHPHSTLQDNGIHDGELLLLAPHEIPAATADDLIHPTWHHPEWTPTARRRLCAVIAVWSSAIGVAVLGYGTAPTAIPAVIAAVSLVAAVITARDDDNAVIVTALNGCATMFAAASGYLAVPGEALTPKLMLAAAAATAVSTIALRLTGTGTTAMVAVASFSALSTVTAAGCVLIPGKAPAAGAVLGALSLTLLAVAARLAIVVTRLPVPRLDDTPAPHHDDPEPSDTGAVLDGLVCGFTASVGAGACLATPTGTPGLVLSAILGIAVLLRARTHVKPAQIVALLVGGTLCLSVVVVRVALTWPPYSQWTTLAAAGAIALATTIGATAPSRYVSPVFRRCIDVADYVTLAAVIPVTCWAGGVFDAVRGLHLP